MEYKGKKINLQPMTPQQIVNDSRQKTEVNLKEDDQARETSAAVSVSHQPNKSDITKSERVPSLLMVCEKNTIQVLVQNQINRKTFQTHYSNLTAGSHPVT